MQCQIIIKFDAIYNFINEQETMKKKIFVPYGVNGQLTKEFGTTRATVARSLAFENETYLGREIRRRALELGGREVEMGCAAPADME